MIKDATLKVACTDSVKCLEFLNVSNFTTCANLGHTSSGVDVISKHVLLFRNKGENNFTWVNV